jgi:hypothetical protein
VEPHTQTLFDSASGDAIERREDGERTRRGAQWFYLIAALSLVTSVIALVGGDSPPSPPPVATPV